MRVAKLLRANGTSEDYPSKGDEFTLEEMQKAVGGYIQAVPTVNPGETMLVNEDGLDLNLPVNEQARSVMHPDYRWPGVPVVGDVLVMKTKDFH